MPSKKKTVEAKGAKQIVNVNVNLQEKKKTASKKKGQGKGKKVQAPYRSAPAFHDTGAGYVSYQRPIVNEPYIAPPQIISAPSRQFIQDIPNPYTGALSSRLELSDDQKVSLYNFMVDRYMQNTSQARNQSVQGAGINIQPNPSELRANSQVNTLLQPDKEPSLGSMIRPQTVPEEVVNIETYDDPKVNEILNSRMDTIPQALPVQTFGLNTLNTQRQYDNDLSHLVDMSRDTKQEQELGKAEETEWEDVASPLPIKIKPKKKKTPVAFEEIPEASGEEFTMEVPITKKKGRPAGSKNKPKPPVSPVVPTESASSAVLRMFKVNAVPDVKL